MATVPSVWCMCSSKKCGGCGLMRGEQMMGGMQQPGAMQDAMQQPGGMQQIGIQQMIYKHKIVHFVSAKSKMYVYIV